MAMFIPGMKCPLCGQPINRGDEHIMFGPFVANENDALFLFSDGVFHTACLHKHELSAKAIALHEECSSKAKNRRCSISGELITDAHRYLSVGLLASDPSDPLHRFNFKQFDRAALVNWPERNALVALLSEALASGRMKGKGIEWLRRQIESPQDGVTAATR